MNKILIILVLSLQSTVFSQCLTDYYHNEAKKANPQIAETQRAFLSDVPQVKGQSKRATKFIIPVVFHVIHTNGPENISKAQIESQIKVLNQDFSLNNANRTAIRAIFKNIAADCEIEFRLAKIDPQGNCTEGINRVYSPLHVQARDNVKSISGARWPNNKYLNVWTVSSIRENGSTGGTTLGYAYLPYSISSGLSNLDGIVIRADYTGTMGTASVSGAGRTLTHEVGHYLGLLHTFEEGCAGINTEGDYCDDTPPVEETFTNANCPATGNSCHTETPDLVDQWENYMDYSTGTCQSMFSLDQKSIMHGVLTNSNTMAFRKNMVSEANLIATGVMDGNTTPVAFFSSSARTVCVGQAVSFYDISCKAEVTSKQWTLPGSTVTSTNIDTPVVSYKTPGQYKVTLKVANGAANNTLAVDNYITVLPATAMDKPTIVQDFESPTWNTGTGWSILDAGAVKFTRDTTSVAYRGKSVLMAPITSATAAGQRFQLITPPIDLRSLKGKTPKISMMVSYQRQSATSSEELRFYHSRGCEKTNWSQFLIRNSAFISYTTAFSPTFKPSAANQWKLITFNLNSFENDSNISFMVEVVGNKGNPVYIDAINIGQYTTGISDVEKEISLNVYPNPSGGELNIDYRNEQGETEVWLENIEGKKVCTMLEKTTETGEITVRYNTSGLLPDGIYILKIKSNEQIINKKVIFAN